MSVPSILMNKPLRRPTDMNIQSEILHPINFNQNSAKFVFDNKGILDSNSRLNIALTTTKGVQVDVGAANTPTDAGTVIKPLACDSILFTGAQLQYLVGTDGVIDTVGPISTTVATFAAADMTANGKLGVKVGDFIYNTEKVQNISVITAISTTTYTFSPAFAQTNVAGNSFAFYSCDKILIGAQGANVPLTTPKYYNKMMVRFKASGGGFSDAGLGGIRIGTVASWDPTAITQGAFGTAAEAVSYIGTLTLDGKAAALSNPDGSVLSDAQKKLILFGQKEANSEACAVYNPRSVVLGQATEVNGKYNGFRMTASNNCLPNATKTTILRYYAVGADAKVEATVVAGINWLDPPNKIAYTSIDFNSGKGFTKICGTGGVSSIVLVKNELTNPSTLPISTGIASVIKRAVLTIGGREISSLDAVGHFNTITNMLNSTEYRDKILLPLQGVNDAMKYGEDVSASLGVATQGFITMKDEKEIRTPGTASEFIDMPDRLKIGETLATTPEFSLPLSDLIPMMRGVKLPLFAINQEVALLIEFSEDTNGHRIVQEVDFGGEYGKSIIQESSVFMMTDYLYYEAEMDAVLQEINSVGWQLPYEDVITIDSQLPAIEKPSGVAPNDFTRTETSTLLYLGGKMLRNIIIQKQSTNVEITNGIGNNRLEGVYNSRSLQRPETYNLTIDNVPFYDNDIELSGLQSQELSRCFDTHLQIPFARYSLAELVEKDYTFDRDASGYITNVRVLETLHSASGRPLCRLLSGNQNYFGINIGNIAGMGREMSNLPLVFRHITERTSANDEYSDALAYRFYCTIKRGLNISQGGYVAISE
tara:strand:- start:331 stop:2796 length:2466 start_codon:yes stop_codon:yes gene_type:complete